MPETLSYVAGETTTPDQAVPSAEETMLHLVAIDQTVDGKLAARDEAVRQRTEALNEGTRFKKVLKGIWDNVAGEHRFQRNKQNLLDEIKITNDVQRFEFVEHAEASHRATLNRFASSDETMIHAEAGEQRETLSSENELAQEMKQLIRRNLEGELSDEATAEERTRILCAYGETQGGGILKGSEVTIDNLFAIRDAVRGAVDHGERLDRVLENMTVSIGESRTGVRTEAEYSRTDRVIDKMNQSKIGARLGPEVVIAVTTIAGSVLRLGSKKVIGAAAMTIAPGLAGGFWAGAREHKRVGDERRDHSRAMAKGEEFEVGSKRREEMEKTRYETAFATDLIEELRSRCGEEAELEDQTALVASLDTLAAVQTRILLSDKRNMDLISYTDGRVEEQRLALDKALTLAKSIVEQRLDPDMRQALGMSLDMSLQETLGQRANDFIESIDEDIAEKDTKFKKLRRRRVLIAGATGVAAGLTLGFIAQEGMAALSDSRQGLVEQLWHAHNSPFEGQQHQTLLNGFVHGDGGQDTITHHAAEATFNHSTLGEHAANYSVSADHNLVDNGNGTLDLVDKTGHVSVDNLPVNPDGSLPQASIDSLHSHGMSVVDTSHNIDVVSSHAQTVSVDQYVAHHQNQISHVSRDGWYDNNTPAPKFDRNELGLHWGGESGSNGNGGYAMDVSTMTSGGSFSGDHAADWAVQAKAGNLTLAISASGNTQAEVFMVPIGADGKIDILAGSPAAHFFSHENGQTVFHGAYAEVVQKTSIDSHGVEHIRPLATLVGHDNVGSISDTVETHTAQLKPEYQITTNGYDTTEHFESFTEMAPVIPVVSRRAMENMRSRSRTPELLDGGYTGYGRELGPEDIERQRKITSPRFIENPDAQLNPGQELDWFKDKVTQELGDDYVAEIDQMVASSPELSNLPDNLRSILMIPVKATGSAESKNIYKVLTEAYGRQDKAALDDTVILLHVNWFKSDENNLALQENKEFTLNEIERARKDNPNMRIAVVQSRWDEEQKEGGIIGHVARRMNHAALFALDRAVKTGAVAAERDVIIIRNDADPKGIGKEYLGHFLDAASASPETDIFTGTTQFGSERSKELPGLVFAANFMQSLELLSAIRDKNVHTGGANFGVRAATLAAVGVGLFRNEHGKIANGAGYDDVQIGRTIGGVRNGYFSLKAPYSRSEESSASGSNASESNGYRSTAYQPGADLSTARGTKRKVAVRVSGARIDTDSDRQENYYLQGHPIVQVWNGGAFDRGGHRDRDADIAMVRTEENMAKFKNPDFLIESIRNDIEGTIRTERHFRNVRTALAFTFAGGGASSDKYYRLIPGPSEVTARSAARFEFTAEGKKYLLKHLARDRRGRFDPFGSRLSRQLYGETKPNARRRATHAMMARV